MKPQYDYPPGVLRPFEMGMKFAYWCDSQRPIPTWQQVVGEFEVSRPTAFRWLQSWKNMRGISR